MILQHKHLSLKDGWFSEQVAGKQTNIHHKIKKLY